MAFKRFGFGQVEPNQLSAQKTGQIYASLPLDKDVKVLQNGEFMYYDYASGTVVADPDKLDPKVKDALEPMLVFNEIKLYDEYYNLKDFAMIRISDSLYVTNPAAVGRVTQPNYGWAADQATYADGSTTNVDEVIKELGVDLSHNDEVNGYKLEGIAPRLFKTNVGDVYTTNMVKVDTEEEEVTYSKKDLLTPKYNAVTKTMVLEKIDSIADANVIAYVVAKSWKDDKYTMPDGQPGLKLQRIK